ncbi:MAG: arginine--tRNA ligase [Solirubrobacterales bacterium]|jgi:arginyl-tRNA synthetase|nr:arginine--tRNA ligase [Solirubrobacterales bacterium]
MSDALSDLRASVDRAAAALGGTPKAPPALERPKQAGHGDYATNAAMLLTKALGRPPRDVAADLAAALQEDLGDGLAGFEVAGPGFLNLTLSDAWHAGALAGALEAGEAWGRSTPARARWVNVEFVSANPTGPVHIGGARNAAYGDALARALELAGHRVHREFYVNDYGSQIQLLGRSVQARARGEEIPEGGYLGGYITDLAGQIPGAAAMELDELAQRAVALMVDAARASLERFRVTFDTWFSEKALHDEQKVERAFELLAQQGRTFEQDGALWLRTTELGDDKDRVIERASGEHTYFASDIAYHQDKRERGFDLLIDVWGADHHGYVPRMHVGFQALGGAPDELELVIMQLVSLREGEKKVSMSKRAGEFVTLDDLVDDIGVDAARWYLLQRSHDTTIELDLELAKQQSSENPVYYVQYAHARMAAILREATAAADPTPPAEPLHPSERALVRSLLAWPAEVAEAAERRAPHRIATYALDLAQTSAAFYRDCKVRGEPSEAFRVAVCRATQQTLASALGVLGVSAPDEM